MPSVRSQQQALQSCAGRGGNRSEPWRTGPRSPERLPHAKVLEPSLHVWRRIPLNSRAFGLRALSSDPYTPVDFSAGPGCRPLPTYQGETRARSLRQSPASGLASRADATGGGCAARSGRDACIDDGRHGDCVGLGCCFGGGRSWRFRRAADARCRRGGYLAAAVLWSRCVEVAGVVCAVRAWVDWAASAGGWIVVRPDRGTTGRNLGISTLWISS
mgnify:CR=1 FL=1